MLTLKESYNVLSNLTGYLNKNLTKRQLTTLIDIEECLKTTIEKIEKQIEYLKEIRKNIKEFTDKNKNSTDITVMQNVSEARGESIRIRLNIEFLQELLNDIRGVKENEIKL